MISVFPSIRHDSIGNDESCLCRCCFVLRRILSPKDSTIVRTKLFPTRQGVSRLYVTFVSNDVCSQVRTIPLEMVRELIVKPSNIQPTLNVSNDMPNKTDTNIDKASASSLETSSVDQKTLPIDVDQSTVALTSSPVENNELNTTVTDCASIKPDTSIQVNENHDVDKLESTKDRTDSHSNSDVSSSLANGSTLSLDKDKISIDSLDIATDQRSPSTHVNS
jgi:hypothetical protein